MPNFLLDPIIGATTPPTFYDFPPPILWGGLSAVDALPSFGLFPQPIGVGRSFYGSLFYPYNFASPMERWGDEWYQHDLLDAGAKLAYWGDAITMTDPWRMHYGSGYSYGYYPPYFYYPMSAPPPLQITPLGNQNATVASSQNDPSKTSV